jgi:hypothetical protein
MRFAVAAAVLLTLSAGVARGDDEASAREHYVKGTRAYELGLYDEAIGQSRNGEHRQKQKGQERSQPRPCRWLVATRPGIGVATFDIAALALSRCRSAFLHDVENLSLASLHCDHVPAPTSRLQVAR